MRIPAMVYVLALGAFALITTELGVIGILPQVSEASGITIDRAGWLLISFALVIALLVATSDWRRVDGQRVRTVCQSSAD
jgi:predicted MFS family arabinose efflux permease